MSTSRNEIGGPPLPQGNNNDAGGNPVGRMIMTLGVVGLSIWMGGLAVFVHRMNYSVTMDQLTTWMFSLKCMDFHEDCSVWAKASECSLNAEYMSQYCSRSCGLCEVGKNETTTGKTSQIVSSIEPEATTTTDEREEEAVADEGMGVFIEGDDESEEEEETARKEDELCADLEGDACRKMAEDGECDTNKEWMEENCARACDLCPCSNAHELCEFWAKSGECDANPNYMLPHCTKACQRCTVGGEDDEEEPASASKSSSTSCADKSDSKLCAQRRNMGECERNPGWMIVFCGKTCGKCDLMTQAARCTPEVFNDTKYKYEDALKKGDLTRIFKSVMKDYPQTELVLQPPDGPWVIKLPNFVTDVEREHLLRTTLPLVKRSTDQGEFDEEGVQTQVVSTGRTSSNAWCLNECADDPIVHNLTERISKLVHVPVKNFESYQILQYKLGQKYDVHHDSSEDDFTNLSGPRILTFFIYLSDVEEGGETFFDKLNIKVKPQKNMAIMWPSVLDDNPSKIDTRTTHAALPVIKGEKLAANIWMHMRDFVTPNLWGCTGAFDDENQ